MHDALIDAATLLPGLQAETKAAALEEVVAGLVEGGGIPAAARDEVCALIHRREELGTTGIGNGVAVPHVKTAAVDQLVLALARSPQGLEYDAIDGQPVHTIFFLVGPAEPSTEHLEILRWVSSLARNADFRRFVQAAAGADEMRELLREMSSPE